MWFKGSTTVAPDDLENSEEERRGVTGWIKRHPVLASVGITLLILGIIAAIVVPITCSVHGCPPKKEESIRISLTDGAPLRLVVAFLNDVDVIDIVPPILRNYTARVQMALSNLQILEAIDEAVLNVIITEIKKRTDVDFLVRDFVLKAPSVIQSVTGSNGNTGRRLQQASGLNDSGISNAWWFDKINVTGAWRQLGIDFSNPQRQTSDVIIAVTDSGAQVTHPDLIGSWWVNPREVDNDLTDNDGNVFIDDVYGACFSTSLCSPTYPGNNQSRCGIGPNTSTWNGITDRTSHGTKIAGIIGANPNNGIGLAGIAPNLRQMILKVTDESLDSANPPYAYSDVVRAVDYACGKGARIFSMSFGNNAKLSMTAFNKPSLDEAAAAYRTLFLKYNNSLFVAAAGNEWSNLEVWRAANYTYSPCMVETPNVLCVGSTNSTDDIFYANLMNQDVGTNWGPNAVDMGAPGYIIYTTDTSLNGLYSTPSGTSFSTPMVASVAGLVLSALGGQTRATSQTPATIKNILMTSGDALPSLQGRFRTTRRLNAGNAVAMALSMAATNRTIVQMARSLTSVNSSVALQAWEYYWYRTFNPDLTFNTAGLSFVDYYLRIQANSNFNVLRYGGTTMFMATSMVRIDTPGMYSIQARTNSITPERWQVLLGEVTLVWNAINSTAYVVDLIFPSAGFYNMTLYAYPDSSTTLNFLWMVPTIAAWSNPNLFWVLHDDGPSTRHYDPNLTPRPALWHLVWNESASFDDFIANRAYFVTNKEPRLYRTMTTWVPDMYAATGTDLRNMLYGTGGAPANGQTVVYGYARANLRPMNYSTPMAFRLLGPHSRLYINDQLIMDRTDNNDQLGLVTACVTLRNNTNHELFFYFAARLNSTNPVGITWTPCTTSTAPLGNSGLYTSFSASIATNFIWQPSSINGLPRGFRCDAWPGDQTINQVLTTPPFGTPPTLTWMYPRDCPDNFRTSNGECRIQAKLVDLFPNITEDGIWHIRCYTYYAGSIARGTSGALILSAAVFQHLAGVQVFDQWADNTNTNYAPYTTRLAPNLYQLYVIEWVAWGLQWNSRAATIIFDGVQMSFNPGDYLTTNSATMVLPSSALASMTPRGFRSP